MENGNFSQSGKRQAQRIDFRQEKGGDRGTGLDRLIQVENAQKFIVQKKFFLFFSFALPSNEEGKGKKNFHLPVGCCFLLLRGLCVRGRGSKSVLKCKEMFVCALQLLLSCLETA